MPLHLFQGYGIEVEYIIVRKDTLDVLPVSDEVIRAAAGEYAVEVEFNGMGWSNEFVKHVLEIRNSRPSAPISKMPQMYQEQIARINGILGPMGGMLMPTSMHPWMDPEREAVFWNRENRIIYSTYDRIFGCRTHGWANIQSTQINLPFSGDDEFGRLHAAIRMVLPIIPAIAASSPVYGGKASGNLDSRLTFYRRTQSRVPSIAGDIIPENVFSIREYQSEILERMYRDIAPLDPEGILQFEWLNSRGAIPRHDRSAIEIRTPDIQECPEADMAVISAIVAAVRGFVEERWVSFEEQKTWETRRLLAILDKTILSAENTVIDDSQYVAMFGLRERQVKAGDLWGAVIQRDLSSGSDGAAMKPLDVILKEGTLSTRILKALDGDMSRRRLGEVYGSLCGCLANGTVFRA